jgi:mono/diheme cytochrome c family protein
VITRVLSLGAAIVFAALFVASAQTPAASEGPQPAKSEIDQMPVDTGLIDRGKATYAAKCSHCHGFGMVNAGTVAPDLRKFPSDEARFVTTVKLGKNNRMPPWGDLLSDDQIESLWAYVSSQHKP